MSTPSQLIKDLDWATLSRWLALGLAGGAATGLGTSLSKHINAVHEDDELGQDADYIPVTLPKQASEPSTLQQWIGGPEVGPIRPSTAALAIPLAALAGFGAHNLTRLLYDKYRERDLQQQLEQAERQYGNAVLGELQQQQKSASGDRRPPSTAELGSMLALSPIVLSGLAAYLLTNRYLDKTYPLPKLPKPEVLPVRLQTPTESEGAEDLKVASDDRDHVWHATLMALIAEPKLAADSELAAMVKVAALGGPESLEQTLDDADANTMLKCASELQRAVPIAPSPLSLMLGGWALLKSASLGPVVKFLIATELKAAAPRAQKAATDRWYGSEFENEVIKVAADLNRMTIAQAMRALGGEVELSNGGGRMTHEKLAGMLSALNTPEQVEEYLSPLLTVSARSQDSRGERKDEIQTEILPKDPVDQIIGQMSVVGEPSKPRSKNRPDNGAGGTEAGD